MNRWQRTGVTLVSVVALALSSVGCGERHSASVNNKKAYKKLSHGVVRGWTFTGFNRFEGNGEPNKKIRITVSYAPRTLDPTSAKLRYFGDDPKLLEAVFGVAYEDTIELDSDGYIKSLKPGPKHMYPKGSCRDICPGCQDSNSIGHSGVHSIY